MPAHICKSEPGPGRRGFLQTPLNLQYGAEQIGKGEQLKVNSVDFPTLAATGLHSAAELEHATTVTGKAVEEITRLGRPGMASGTGFLAADEDLVSVLQADNEMVRRLGLKHPDLARPLFHVWNLLLLAVPFGVSAPAVWVAEHLLRSGSAIVVIWLLLIGGPLLGVIGSLILGLWPQSGLSVGKVCGGIGWTLLLLGMGLSFPVPWILFFAGD